MGPTPSKRVAPDGLAIILPSFRLLSELKLSCKDEVLLWAQVASGLPNTELWQSVESLVQRKIVSKRSVAEFGYSDPQGNAVLRSQAILNGIVIPYLKGTFTCP